MIHSDTAREGALKEHRSIKLSIYGILFMGTPHQGGGGVNLGEVVLNVASILISTNNRILQHLKRDSEWLQQHLAQYALISRDFVTNFAYEMLPTLIALGRTILVSILFRYRKVAYEIQIVSRPSAVVPGAADAESNAILKR